MRRTREPQPDVVDVLLQLGVAIDAHLTPDLGIELAPCLNFLSLAHERELAIAGDRIRRARCERRRHQRGNERSKVEPTSANATAGKLSEGSSHHDDPGHCN